MRALRLVLAAALLAVAVLALLAAHDVRAWGSALSEVTRASRRILRVRYAPATTILPEIPRALGIGLDDDRALRRAVRAYRVAERTPRGFDNGETQTRVRSIAEVALSDVATRGAPAAASPRGTCSACW